MERLLTQSRYYPLLFVFNADYSDVNPPYEPFIECILNDQ